MIGGSATSLRRAAHGGASAAPSASPGDPRGEQSHVSPRSTAQRAIANARRWPLARSPSPFGGEAEMPHHPAEGLDLITTAYLGEKLPTRG